MEINSLTLLVIIPVLIAIVNLILPKIISKILTLLGLVYLLYLAFNLYVRYNGGEVLEYNLFAKLIFSLDNLAIFTIIFIQLLSLLIYIFSLKGVIANVEKYFLILYPLTVGACNGAVVSVNSISLLIFWGVSGILLYLFAILGKEDSNPETARKTLLIVGGSDAILILGLILMRYIGSAQNWLFLNSQLQLNSGLTYIAFFSVLIAAFAKAGGFPFHTWVPDFSKDSIIEGAAFLPASLDKLLGIYLLARIVLTMFVLTTFIHMIVITLGAITVIIAVMMAMVQHNGRKLLGYHAVSQVGYMIMGVGAGGMLAANGKLIAGSIVALVGGLFHMINHTIYKSNLFLSLGAVEKQTGINDLDKLGGLGNKMPITFVAALIGAFSISGIPPFNGFFSKWMIYQGFIQIAKNISQGYQIWILICLIMAVFGSALTLASFLKFIHAIFLGRSRDSLKDTKKASWNHQISNGLLSLLCIVFGLFAIQLPIKYFLAPVVQEQGWAFPELLGLYEPKLLLLTFGLVFLIGYLIFLLVKNVRYDEVYLGGMEALEKFRISGTEFYKEIKDMEPLKTIYDWAEKKVFDIYDLGKSVSLSFGKLFSRLHSGQLHFYSLWIVIGVLIFLWILK